MILLVVALPLRVFSLLFLDMITCLVIILEITRRDRFAYWIVFAFLFDHEEVSIP